MKKAIQVTGKDFDSIVSQSDKPVFIDFYASWCDPCRVLGPTVDQIAASFEGRASVLKVNVEEESDLASRFNVRSIPTVVILREGKEAARVTGAIAREAFLSTLEHVLGDEKAVA